jgi:hypothetical protein
MVGDAHPTNSSCKTPPPAMDTIHIAAAGAILQEATMLDWTVTGADRDTGEDRVLAVNALTEEEARAAASSKGLLVESVRRAADPPPPQSTQSFSQRALSVPGKAKPRDPLRLPRFAFLLLALGYSVGVGFLGFDRIFAYLLWGCWLLLGVAGIVMRARA